MNGCVPQGSFPVNLQLVLVLRPSTLFQRTLSDIFYKFNRDEFKMKVPVCFFYMHVHVLV